MRKDQGPKGLALALLGRSRLAVQMAAVISDREERIVSFGWNNDRQHAEVHAISRANRKRLEGSTITVAGVRGSSGALVFARPCDPGCMDRIRAVGIRCAVYRNKSDVWITERIA